MAHMATYKRFYATAAISLAVLLGGCSVPEPINRESTVAETLDPSGSEAPSDDAGTSTASDYPTPPCLGAMSQAASDLEAHYAEWAGDYSDAEEQAWQAVMEPLYSACDGPVDLMAGFKEYPSVAGVTGPQFVDAFWLEVFCYQEPNSQSCSGYSEVLSNY